MTLQDLFREGEKRLLKVFEPEEAKSSAWFLLAGCFAMDSKDYLLLADQEADPDMVSRYQTMISRRIEHEPTAYILGEWEFMGLPIHVSPSVLIPRQDTETLVEETIRYVNECFTKGSRIRILDLCTGSGCIAVSLKHMLDKAFDVQMTASDLSKEALEVAQTNALRNNTDIRLICSDLFDQIEEDHYDIIVCNPPYIAEKIRDEIQDDVRDYEPSLALFGGDDGLGFYRRILPSLRTYLAQEGAFFLEIGDDQGRAVKQIAEEAQWSNVRLIQDLAGHDRVLFGKKGKR
ncbi:MAG: peptide chain release factor N(5)-glutamine methyltransferase [Firmicutes bacterium]|nr:peptide chain release factor N(5)-glutamine methyltransferase [Bacillota bacterium]